MFFLHNQFMGFGGLHLPDFDLGIEYTTFIVMVVAALLLSKSRLGWPLKWAETFYHEMSHGVVCLLTGGRVTRLELNFDGSGCSYTKGGWRVPTLMAGYMGASIWGGIIYMSGWWLGDSGATAYLKFELAVQVIAFVLWGRDLTTWIILAIIGAVYALAIGIPDTRWIPLVLQFIGIYVMFNAIRAPLFLIDGEHVGDGADLADILFIPEWVWILFWWLFALAVLLFCMSLTLPGFEGWLEHTAAFFREQLASL